MKIEANYAFDLEKRKTALMQKMIEGELTEDDFQEEVEKLNHMLKEKELSKKEKREVRYENEQGLENHDENSYGKFFSQNKKEFRNILGL